MKTYDEEKSVKEKKQMARRDIIDYCIDDDKEAIVKRWTQTFIHKGSDQDPANKYNIDAVRLMMATMAAVARGYFQVNESGKKGEYKPPSNVFCIADYLSHASRVMIDLSELTETNKNTVLTCLSMNHLDARASTHLTERKEGVLIEKKSLGHGVFETVLNVVDSVGEVSGIGPLAAKIGIQGPALTDYGIDIQMGGVGQINLSGGISERGRDGHIFVYREGDAVMIGLEQTKPPMTNQDMRNGLEEAKGAVVGVVQNVLNFLSRTPSPPAEGASPVRKTPSPPLDSDDDNACGLSGEHSMAGLSDDYTAAGSLYFSNLIYKLKLMEDKGALTPAKYNGMLVRLNDRNVDSFLDFFNQMGSAHEASNVANLLKQVPQSATTADLSQEEKDSNCLFLMKSIENKDLDELFRQLNDVNGPAGLEKSDIVLFKSKLKEIKALLAEPRVLPVNGILSTFVEGEIASTNDHVKRLERTFNRAVMTLKQRVADDLMVRLENPSEVIVQMKVLKEACRRQNPNGQLDLIDGQLSTLDTLIQCVRMELSKETHERYVYFPFRYLESLLQLEKSMGGILSASENDTKLHRQKMIDLKSGIDDDCWVMFEEITDKDESSEADFDVDKALAQFEIIDDEEMTKPKIK